MRAFLAFALVGLLLVAGCLSASKQPPAAALGATPATTAGLPFPPASAFDINTPEGKPLDWSHPVEKGTYAVLPAKVVKVPSFDGVKLALGIYLPDVPNGTKVPVLMDVGPYYGELDDDVGTPAHVRLGKFLIDNLVPHGYAVVQASVRGTGQSEGCNDYLGATEQHDIDVLLTYLGEAPWSSGAVAVIGKSYDGTTAWEAATTGNKYLKTIVPIEGIDSMQQLHFRNGSAETRSLILGESYYSYGATQGMGSTPDDPQTAARVACPDPFSGPFHAPEGAYGYATGGGQTSTPLDMGPQADYWTARDYRDRALKNFHGSLFYIHGFQDWNVKPSQGIDIYNQFPGAKKMLVGEWAHVHADRASEHPNVRMDWAEMLLRWFDQELKGAKTDTGPAVQVEDTHGHWTTEPENAYPPLDATPLVLHPEADGKLVAKAQEGSDMLYAPTAGAGAPASLPGTKNVLSFVTDPLPNGTRIEGLPTLHVTVTPTSSGGLLWAELHEVLSNGTDLWIGRAQMDLRYADGGMEPQTVTPGQPIVAKMEFYPLDAHILPGSRIRLALTQEQGGSDVLPSAQTAPVTVTYGDKATTFTLPTVVRDGTPTRWDTDLWLPTILGAGGATTD
ncbi:MAG: X-Pro dipeptidyl-peptidase [Thermoplasmata archaeon]|jgi:predicted acyl esterase|nr:X-Pro dipeptidyl-peptidase [Thermoplasmata archaeon]